MVQVVTSENSGYILEELRSYDGLALDIETTGLEFPIHSVVGIGIVGFNVDLLDDNSNCEISPNVYYFPTLKIGGQQTRFDDPIDYKVVDNKTISELMDVVGNCKYIAGHNVKFDLLGLRTLGLELNPDIYLLDTLPCFRFISESGKKGEFNFGLDNLMKTYLGEEYASYKGATKEVIPTAKCPDCKRNHVAYWKVPFEQLSQYCGRDALAVIDLFDYIWKKYPKIKVGLAQQYNTTKSLYEVESRGVMLDSEYIRQKVELYNENYNRYYDMLMQHIDMNREKIEEYCEKNEKDVSFLDNFSITNDNQVDIVMTALGHKTPDKSPKTGKNSWKLQVLVNIPDPIAALLVVLKKLAKCNSMFIAKYEDAEILHPIYSNGNTVTGRLTAKEPNVQQLPNGAFDFNQDRKIHNYDAFREYIQSVFRTDSDLKNIPNEILDYYKVFSMESFVKKDDNMSIRSFIIPRENHKLVSIDYKQLEVCVLFFYMQNKELLNYVRKGGDVHDMTTKLVFNKDKEQDAKEWDLYRKQAKHVTFGIIYGLGNFMLAKRLGIGIREATNIKNKFMSALPGLKELYEKINRTVDIRKHEHGKGYLESLYGRRYYLTDDKMYTAINRIVQGSAGEFVNEKFVEIHNFLKGYKSNVLILIHDEILFEIHESEMFLIPKLRDLMVQNRFGIPLSTDVEISANSWGELSKEYTKSLLTNQNKYDIIKNNDIGKDVEIMENEITITPSEGSVNVPRNYNIERKITAKVSGDFISFGISIEGVPEDQRDSVLGESWDIVRTEMGRQIEGNNPRQFADAYYDSVKPAVAETPQEDAPANEAPAPAPKPATAPAPLLLLKLRKSLPLHLKHLLGVLVLHKLGEADLTDRHGNPKRNQKSQPRKKRLKANLPIFRSNGYL